MPLRGRDSDLHSSISHEILLKAAAQFQSGDDILLQTHNAAFILQIRARFKQFARPGAPVPVWR